ncbi:MAG: cyclic pyranopterin monophosphate synthase MoaC [Butyricicoccus sp.]
MKLTHLDENGSAHMDNIGSQPVTQREAVAQSVLTMQPETLRMILDGTVPKGDVFACARIAGIMAAKRTAELIPMCHPIPIESVDIAIEAVSETQVRVVSTLRCSHKTGIEMEALTAASVAALTVYDMCKAVDRGMRIDETLLLHKTGGKAAIITRKERGTMTLLEQLQAAAENARKGLPAARPSTRTAYSIRAISCRRNA